MRLAVLMGVLFLSSMATRAVADSAPEERPAVYIVAIPAEPSLEFEAQRVGVAVREALSAAEQVASQKANRIFLGYSGEAERHLETARERLAAGRQAYLQLEFDAAVEVLTQALGEFDEAEILLETPDELGEALLLLGASQLFSGDEAAAHETFGRLHSQMPSWEPDPELFHPKVIAAYGDAAPRRAPKVSIAVRTKPSGAEAFVDYQARGRTPLEVSGLPPGTHVVRVTHPDYEAEAGRVGLRRRRSATAELELSTRPEGRRLSDALNAMATQARMGRLEAGEEGLRTFARALEVDHLGVMKVARSTSGDGLALELVMFTLSPGRTRARIRSDQTDVREDLGAEVDRMVRLGIHSVLEPLATAQRVDVASNSGQEEERRPTGAWVWAAFLGTAAVGAVAAFFLLRDDGDDDVAPSTAVLRF